MNALLGFTLAALATVALGINLVALSLAIHEWLETRRAEAQAIDYQLEAS